MRMAKRTSFSFHFRLLTFFFSDFTTDIDSDDELHMLNTYASDADATGNDECPMPAPIANIWQDHIFVRC